MGGTTALIRYKERGGGSISGVKKDRGPGGHDIHETLPAETLPRFGSWRRYSWAISRASSASLSWIRSPETSTVTEWIVPVKVNGGRWPLDAGAPKS